MGMKIVFCGYEIKTSATRATHKAQTIENKGVFEVAVLENTATRAVTHCYPHINKGRRETTMVHYPSLRELKRTLGADYRIRTIDWEKCLYRDFGNGFNVEVSGVSRANRKGSATLYLWFGERAHDCLIVKTVHDVGRGAEAIGEAVDDLCEYSNSLIAHGYDSRDKLFHLKNNI